MGTKGPKNAIARGPPESAEGRSSDEGEGECFAPFYLKIMIFRVKMLFFWSWNAFRLISGHLQKIVKFSNFRQNFDIFCDTFPDQFESSRGPIELILSELKALT